MPCSQLNSGLSESVAGVLYRRMSANEPERQAGLGEGIARPPLKSGAEGAAGSTTSLLGEGGPLPGSVNLGSDGTADGDAEKLIYFERLYVAGRASALLLLLASSSRLFLSAPTHLRPHPATPTPRSFFRLDEDDSLSIDKSE